MRRFVFIGWLALLAVGFAWADGAWAATDDEFYQGLEHRGLQTLMEAYLKQQGEQVEQPGQERAGPPGQREMRLAGLALQQLSQVQNMAARDKVFQQARRFYEQAIQARQKALDAVPADKLKEQNEARLDLIRARLALANMVFQQWIKNDLDLLEVTQRYGGDRQRVIPLLQQAVETYAKVVEDGDAWLSNLAMLPGDYSRFASLNKRREVRDAMNQAKYFSAWAQYYCGWLLPKGPEQDKGNGEDKGKEKGESPRSRNVILNDAITAFQPFANDDRDQVANKWYARLGIGMAYRELGQYKKALQQMAMVSPPPVAKDRRDGLPWQRVVRIRTAYEQALTHLDMGQYAEARKRIEEARKKFGNALQKTLHGQAMPIVEAASYIKEGEATGKEALKDKGINTLKQFHKRPNPWPFVVQRVMTGLVGELPPGEQTPFQLWITANDLMAEAQRTEDPQTMRKAADRFKAYAEKVGPEDKNYPTALYTQAAALMQIGRKAEAAALFQEVADKFTDYRYAKASAQYAVAMRGQVYENAKTDENRQAYEDALGWFVSKYLQTDPNQQYYYALILYRGGKYLKAADAFARVPEKAENYPDSRYWVALCHLEHLRSKVLASKNAQLILSAARDVARRLLDFAKYAFEAQNAPEMPEAKKQQLLQWAQFAYINAADVYLYQEVALPADALPILEETEKKFDLSKDARGRVLKLKIDAYQKLDRLAEARQVLDEFLAVAEPQDVGPVLRGLFGAMTDEVRELIERNQKKLAANRVDQAKKLGDRFLQWLAGSDLPQKEVEIENARYDLAELYLAVGDYGQALQIYQEIGGPRPVKKAEEEGKPLPEECIYGMARAYQGLGDQAAGPDEAKPHYERALELWRVLRNVENLKTEDRWEREYHILKCNLDLGRTEEVKKAINALKIMTEGPLGGKDALRQKQFRELEAQVNK